MQIWTPTVNQVSINEKREERVWNHRFWNAYLNETDPKQKQELLDNWEDPLPDHPKYLLGNFSNANEHLYGDWRKFIEIDEFTNEDGERLPMVKPAGVGLMIEAKQRKDRPFTTLLSKEIFEELIRFE